MLFAGMRLGTKLVSGFTVVSFITAALGISGVMVLQESILPDTTPQQANKMMSEQISWH